MYVCLYVCMWICPVQVCPSRRNGRLSEILYILPSLKLDQLRKIDKIGLMRTALLKRYWRKNLVVSSTARDDLSLAKKIEVYGPAIIPGLLCASEIWRSNSRHTKQLNTFRMIRISSLLRIKWFHKVSNSVVLQRTKVRAISY